MSNEDEWGPNDFPSGCLVTAGADESGGRRLLYANNYAEQLMGRSPGELIGKHLSDILSPASRIIVNSYLLPMLLHDGQFEEIMLDIVSKDGGLVPIVANGVLRSKDDGKIRWSFFDATKRSKLDQELIDTRRKLEEYSEKLYTLSITDELTGLLNRRELKRRAKMILAEARRNHLPISVVVLDIDYFKHVNDSQGHMAGDEILRRLGQILSDHARESDVVGRYGGEEFSFVLPDTGEENALIFTQRLHELVGEIRVDDHPLTISVGLISTEWVKDNAISYERLFELADRAMYRAKSAGRNRSKVARPPE